MSKANCSLINIAYTAPLLLAAGCLLQACGGGTTYPAPVVNVISSRMDMVSGGDALIRITPQTAHPGALADISVSLNGTKVSGSFKPDPTVAGSYLGLVSGIRNGENLLTASTWSLDTQLTLTGYAGPSTAGFATATAPPLFTTAATATSASE